MTSWWPFPPQTREVQLDEKWAFVGKKQKHGDPNDPGDARLGDCWDHVAFDPEHRLVLSVVPGPRTADRVQQGVQDTKRRMSGRRPTLITTDEYAPYKEAILDAYGETITPPRTSRRGRPKAPYKVPAKDLNYATVHKTRKQGRGVKIDFNVVFGSKSQVKRALARSHVSQRINTAFVERHNGTDRHRNARKVRQTYCFSKDPAVHDAMTYLTIYTYNFCRPVRTLRTKDRSGHWLARSPAMAAGLTDHLWSLTEWLSLPAVQRQ